MHRPENASVRQKRGGALQSDIGPAQVHEEQRSGRGHLLAGKNAGSRGGSSLYCQAVDSVCQRGCGDCGFQCPYRGGIRLSGLSFSWNAGV